MKKRLLPCFLLFVVLFLIESCSCDRDKSVYSYPEDQNSAEKNCGTLYIQCCPGRICEEGLYCDPELIICLEEEDDDDEGSIGGGDDEKIDQDYDQDTDDGGEKEDACHPNPCENVENSTGECWVTGEKTYRCQCKKNYTWNESTKLCVADKKTVNCLGLPSHAHWNETSTIEQEWDGTKWTPNDIGTFDPEPSTTECRFVCDENYSWYDYRCNADKQPVNCTGLPENASWNTAESIVQEWNGTQWMPPATGTYDPEPKSDVCVFNCNAGYFYREKTNECLTPCVELVCDIANSKGGCISVSEDDYYCECDENSTWNSETRTCDGNTRTSKCIGLPDYATWNAAASITQKWNGTDWEPTVNAIYSDETSYNECRYKCKTNYTWTDNSHCVADQRPQQQCTGLPANAEWNTVSKIDQVWDGYSWTPSLVGTYNISPSQKECRYKCKDTAHRENNACILNIRKVECTGLPENAEWNTADKIQQTWSNGSWSPPDLTGKYNPNNPSTEECRFKCQENYFWNGTYCDSNPCYCEGQSCESKICNIPNSTGLCIAKGAGKYACECNDGFYWWDDSGCIDKKPLTIGSICTGQNKCYNASAETACPASYDEAFYGQDAQYAELGACIPKNLTLKQVAEESFIVFDNNTGLEWQHTIPASGGYYNWEKAKEYCSTISDGQHDGWRLPTPQEFLTIIDISRTNPALDTTYFSNMSSTTHYFWTSEVKPDETDKAFTASAEQGILSYDSKTALHKVICVWGDTLPTASLTTESISENEVMTDSTTGLTWQKTPESAETWQAALSYCENLTYAGGGWRLPNRNELASLANFSRSKPASDFPEMPAEGRFWSSSTYIGGYPSVIFYLDSSNGTQNYQSKSDQIYVLCVKYSN